MNAKISSKKKLSDEAYLIIRNDIPLRTKIAEALQIDTNSVYISALRKSPRFSLPFLLEMIVKHTGKSKKELLKQN